MSTDSPDQMPDLASPAAYRHWTECEIRYADLDTLGHVNNVASLVFCENAGVRFFTDAGQPVDADLGWMTVRVELEYRAQLHYPGSVRVGTLARKVGRSSCHTAHGLFHQGTCVGTCERIMVLVDRTANRSVAIPPDLRERLLQL
ncbi:MAG: acyl-CoA thioesterase [Alphaproteobacteria bacterium]|nr:acyl-CoA thioesterase [Alphaproteobacteria bacterium]